VKMIMMIIIHEFDQSRVDFTLNLPRKDIQILVGPLTRHTDLNQRLHIIGVHQDSG